MSEYLLDTENIDLNAEDGNGITPYLKAFHRPEHESLVLKMLEKHTPKLNHKVTGKLSDPLVMAGI